MAETLRKVKSYENKSLSNIIEFAAYISTLEIEDIDRELCNIIHDYECDAFSDKEFRATFKEEQL